MEHRWKLGVLGLGEGRSILSAAKSSPLWEVAQICDLNEALCKERVSEFDLERYTLSYEEMLQDPSVDVVGIYTPDPLHSLHIRMALEAGKHVICTKPLMVSLEGAAELLEVQRKSGKHVMVGQSSRYFEGTMRQREDYEAGRHGELVTVETQYISDSRWFLERDWSRQKGFSWLYNFMIHAVDLAVWYLPRVEEVYAMGVTSSNSEEYGIHCPDSLKALLRDQEGHTASVMGGYAMPSFKTAVESSISCTLRGTKGISRGGSDLRYYRGQGGNAVQIMTIHKSKGLEFPVVFLCDTGQGFKKRELEQNVLLHLEGGIGSLWLDTEKRLYFDTEIRREILERKKQESYAEEMRVLYVALTRAKDRLIVTGMGKETWEKTGGEQRLTPEEILGAKSMMDWLHLILCRKEGHHWHLESARVGTSSSAEEDSLVQEEKAPRESGYTEEELSRKLLWRYPHGWRNELPVLLSVSQLKKETAEEEEEQEFSWEELLRPAEEEPAQAVVSGARGGTLFHEVMSRGNLGEMGGEEGREALLADLLRRGILTEKEFEAFPRAWLRRFGESDLCRRMASSPSLLREESFLCGFTPGELHRLVPRFEIPEEGREEELIIVQGVIDAAFLEEDEWVLVDYKTDRRFTSQVLSMYRTQLDLYAHALLKITGKAVKERILYQVRSGTFRKAPPGGYA